MNNFKALRHALLAGCLAACTYGQGGAVAQTGGADDAAVRTAVRTFEAGWNSHDMDAMFQAFAPDVEFVNVVGMYWRGLPDVKRAHQMMHETFFKATSNHIEDMQVRVVSPDAAIAVVRWRKGATPMPDGSVRPEGRDMMSMFLAKRDERWLVVSAQNTPIDEVAGRFNPVAR
jgi:uncharacterized protein (TIGR02246 family)